MGLFDFTGLKKGLSEFTSSLRDTSSRIETLRREREDIACAPPAREDIRNYFEQIIERRSQDHREAIARHLAPLSAEDLQNPQHMQQGQLLAISPAGGLGATPKSLDAALCLLMAPQLKEAIERVVAGMQWPSNALPIAEREKRLAKIDAEIDKLLVLERELVATARSAGIVVEQGAWDSEKLHGR